MQNYSQEEIAALMSIKSMSRGKAKTQAIGDFCKNYERNRPGVLAKIQTLKDVKNDSNKARVTKKEAIFAPGEVVIPYYSLIIDTETKQLRFRLTK